MSHKLEAEDFAALLAALYVIPFSTNTDRGGRFHIEREVLKMLRDSTRMTINMQVDYADELDEYELCAVAMRTPDEDRHGVVSVALVESWDTIADQHIAEAIKAVDRDDDEELTDIWLAAHRLQHLMEKHPEYHDGTKLSFTQIALLADMTSADLRFDYFAEMADSFGRHEFALPVRIVSIDPSERWIGVFTNQSLSRWRHFTRDHMSLRDEILAQWNVIDDEVNAWPDQLSHANLSAA